MDPLGKIALRHGFCGADRRAVIQCNTVDVNCLTGIDCDENTFCPGEEDFHLTQRPFRNVNIAVCTAGELEGGNLGFAGFDNVFAVT